MPRSCIDGERNEVGFRIVALDEVSVRIGTGGIEIAKASSRESARRRRISEDLLAGELRASIRADGILRGVFGDGKRRGGPISCARAREHDSARAEAHHGVEHVDEPGDIDAVIRERPLDGFADISKRGEMNDRGRTVLGEGGGQRGRIKNVALN